MFKISCVSKSRVELGEGPHYNSTTNSFYFVDIRGAAICRYCLSTTNIYQAKLECKSVSFIVPVDGADDQFVIGYDRKVGLVRWDGVSKKVDDFRFMIEVDSGRPSNRLNDGKCDGRGRLWTGTMMDRDGATDAERTGVGSLYCVDVDEQITARKCVENITISNGLAWDRSGRSMFYIDSECRQIWRYDYDPNTATISNKTVVFDYVKHAIAGIPDGMTIDTDDKLWVACFDGSCVIRVDPSDDGGRLLQTIPIPARQVTSVAFGGPQYDTLLVTTARLPITASDGTSIEHTEQAGCIFLLTDLNATGLPPANFNKNALTF